MSVQRTSQLPFYAQQDQQPEDTRTRYLFQTPSVNYPPESCLQQLVKKIQSAWNTFTQTILSCLRYLRVLSPALTPQQREYRIREDASDIRARLGRELQHAHTQMTQERDKAFRYMDAPHDFAHLHEERVGNYQVGICHHQGRRPTMEDEHIATSFSLRIGTRDYPIELFGICDGHGGPLASRYVRDHLPRKLQEVLREFNPHELTEVGIWNALKTTCVRLDQDFKTTYGIQADNQGTTATFALTLNGKLWTANVGDSRTVLDANGAPIQLSQDAKPDDPRYLRGIEHRGGHIEHYGAWRINGDLAVARAIGDHRLNGAASARPKITCIDIPHNGHLILTCDGIYDVASTRQVVAGVHAHRHLTPGTIARDIVYSAYAARSGDNLSALVIKLRP